MDGEKAGMAYVGKAFIIYLNKFNKNWIYLRLQLF